MYNSWYVSMDETKCRKDNKLNKKVSKYKDKHGIIKPEFQSCLEWATNLQNEKWIFKVCYNQLVEYFSRTKRKKLEDLKNDKYIRDKLKSIMNKNRYPMAKLGKEYGCSIYSIENVSEFILILLEAVKRRKVREFLDIPDVFYISRQIKNLGVEYYFEKP